MKRLHLHIKTDNLEKSVQFYSVMFGQAPDKQEADYAKWLLNDPRAHIALSSHGGKPGVDHMGISIETPEELEDIAGRMKERGDMLLQEEAATCCYAKSDKYWARDPQGAVWELFHTFGESSAYGAEPDREILQDKQPTAHKAVESCCSPTD